MDINELKEQWNDAPIWQRVLIAVMLPLAIAGGLAFYWIKPLHEEREKLTQEKQNIEAEVNRYRRLISSNIVEKLQKEIEITISLKEQKEKELYRRVGAIAKNANEVFSLISASAFKNNIAITKAAVESVKTKRFVAIKDKDGNLLLKEVSMPNEESKKPQGVVAANTDKKKAKSVSKKAQQQPDYVELKVMRLRLSVEGQSSEVNSFLANMGRLIYRPYSIKLKPKKGGKIYGELGVEVVVEK